ncbi:MAG: hypothetical protein WA957_13455 [Alteraurantiacibacter sp.]
MKFWIASISAIALATSPALAQGNSQGNGNGKGNNGNRGGPPAAAANPGNGNGNANGNRGNRGGQAEERGTRKASLQQRINGNNNGNANRISPPVNRGNANKGNSGNGNSGNRPSARNNGNGSGSYEGNDRVSVRYDDRPDFDFRRASSGIANGCPPGLARKYNGCRPPGQARKQDADRYDYYSPDWWGLGNLLGDRRGSYYYDDGYLMQMDRGGQIAGYIPLLGGALSIGNAWPDDYRYSQMPTYYESYYGLGQRDNYRYADNIVYRLNPQTSAITSIAALLTGNDFSVGQQMPRGYDVYNVPYSYRDRYYDSPQSMYRYNDGYVYEVDPETRLVTAAIELLT